MDPTLLFFYHTGQPIDETINPDDGQPTDLNGESAKGPFDGPHQPHIIDDGVGEAEASDHIDVNGEDDDVLTGMTSRQSNAVITHPQGSVTRLVRGSWHGLS